MSRLGINRISLFKSQYVSQILLKFDQGPIIAGIGQLVLNGIKVIEMFVPVHACSKDIKSIPVNCMVMFML